MRERILQQVLNEMRVARGREEREAEFRKNAAFRIADISSAQKAYTDALYNSFLHRKKDAPEVERLHEEYKSALAAHGYSEQDFQAAPVCPECGGKGIVNGEPCKCIREDFVKALGKECGIDPEGFSLEDFDASAIKDAAQSESLSKIYSLMSRYVNLYPNVKLRTLVFMGKTGTGKTMLAEAMVRSAVKRGYSALFLTAMNFNNLLLACHTSPYTERESIIHDVMNADLLVLDDLGTEPRLKNVTCEYLLLTLEERAAKKHTTVITSNFTSDDFISHYNERIYSRIFDKRTSLSHTFTGDDLRTM